jgi:hypothetical protein
MPSLWERLGKTLGTVAATVVNLVTGGPARPAAPTRPVETRERPSRRSPSPRPTPARERPQRPATPRREPKARAAAPAEPPAAPPRPAPRPEPEPADFPELPDDEDREGPDEVPLPEEAGADNDLWAKLAGLDDADIVEIEAEFEDSDAYEEATYGR